MWKITDLRNQSETTFEALQAEFPHLSVGELLNKSLNEESQRVVFTIKKDPGITTVAMAVWVNSKQTLKSDGTVLCAKS